MDEGNKALRGVSFKQGDWWVAVCLDHYMVTQAKSEEELGRAIKTMFLTHILASSDLERVPFEGVRKAPQKYWDIYEAAAKENPRRIEPPSKVFHRFPALDIFSGSLAAA